MKAIASILQSYMHRRFFVLLFLVVAILLLVEASILALFAPMPIPIRLFLSGYAYFAMAIGAHLRMTVIGNAADLFPNHRTYQLGAAGCILIFFLVFPMLFAGYVDNALVSTIAISIFLASLALWASFFTFTRYALLASAGWIVLVWLMFSSFDEASPLASAGLRYLGTYWSVDLIAVALVGFVLFGFCYLRMPYDCREDDSFECFKVQDTFSYAGLWFATKSISYLACKKAERETSITRLVRLFQFGILSPIFGMGFFRLGLVILITYSSFRSGPKSLNYLLPAVYYWITAGLTGNFLQHRNRMPLLYLSSSLPSRNAFLRTVVLSYLLAFYKQMIVITLIAVLVYLAFPWTTWIGFPQLCLLGVLCSHIQLSASFLTGKMFGSGAAWINVNIMIGGIVIPQVEKLSAHFWTLIFVISIFSALLFWAAMRKWSRTEFDFAAAA
jgi:hypothetical protein